MEHDRAPTTGESSTTTGVTKIRTPHSCRKRSTALPVEDEIADARGGGSKEEVKGKEPVSAGPDHRDGWDTRSAQSTLVPDQPDDIPERVDPGPEVEGSNPADMLAVETSEGTTPSAETKTEDKDGANIRPYSAFTKNQRWMIVIISSVAGIFSPISSTIYAPAIPTIADQFGKSIEAINLTVTMYLVFQGLTPSFFGSLADSIGRRPVYILTLTIYVLACIGLALTPTSAYWLLMVLRCLQATGGSAVIAIGSGCIGDIATPEERGGYIGLFSAVSMGGPAIGPVLGGIMAYSLSWRWIFWLLAIACGINVVVMIFVLPETLRAVVGDGSIPPPLLNARPVEFIKQRRLEKKPLEKASRLPLDYQQKPEPKKFDPFGSFKMLLYPDIAAMLTFTSLLYVEYYWVLTTYSTLLKRNYGYNDIQIGLCYLPNGIGAMATSFALGRFLNWDYGRAKAKAGYDPKDKISLDGFPIEKVRLRIFPWIVVLYLAACIGFGWAMEARANVAVSLVMNFFIGGGLQATMGITNVLLVDLFPGNGGAITASFNLCRCLSAAALVSAVDALINRIGAGWTYVMCSGVVVVFTPLVWLVVNRGPKWRKQRMDGLQKQANDKAEKQAQKQKSETKPKS